MHRLVVVMVLVPALASAEISDEMKAKVGLITVGTVAGAYASMQTVFMLDDLLKLGYSDPTRTVPAAFLAGVSLIASTAVVITYANRRDEVGIVGGALAAMSSAVVSMFVMLAIHGWVIRQR